MDKPKIGLLPMYIELYDDALPQMRKRIDEFHNVIREEFEIRGVQVVSVPVCRLESEFIDAVAAFEKESADGIVTLHLAYSPSLESSTVLSATRLPVIVLDTTPTYEVSFRQDPEEILYNHGIHGVQDMCNLLVRNGKKFVIEAGHWKESNVINRAVECILAAKIAGNIRNARVGLYGRQFKGMGDFCIPFEKMKSDIGIATVICNKDEIKEIYDGITNEQIDNETSGDLARFEVDGINRELYSHSVKAGLAMRSWMEKEGLSAFTMNFNDFDKSAGLPLVPFLEASKAMARGIGYAGEGDVITAALVGALSSVFPDITFAEMFCPDWKNNCVLLSHMGEVNIDLLDGKPKLREMEFPYTDAGNPYIGIGRLRKGDAVIVNLTPSFNDSYTIIVSQCTMEECIGDDRMKDRIRGYLKPSIKLSDFLERYSEHGGTHHCALVYKSLESTMSILRKLGKVIGWNVVEI